MVRGHSLRSLLVTAVVASCAFGERMPEPAKPQTALAGSTSATARRSAEQPSPERACTANTPVVTSADDGSREPVFNADVLRLRAQAFQRTLYRREFGDEPPSKEPSPSSVAAQNADERLGKFLPVEHEANLASFHDAIDRLANGCYEDTKVRILAYGASHTQADIYTSYLRYYLQSRFGNGGQGFVPLATVKGANRRRDFKVEAWGFRAEYAQQKGAPEHGRFGLLGAASMAEEPDALLKLSPVRPADQDLWASNFELFYGAEPEGGEIAVSADGGTPVVLPATADPPEPRYHGFRLPLGAHDIMVQVLGTAQARLFGVSLERANAGIVVDTLGIGGTRAANMLEWDQRLWAQHLQRRAPSLVLLAYGTNETSDRREPIEEYAANLKRVLVRLRAMVPKASCVLVGPGDFPKSDGPTWVERPRLMDVIRTQREIAPSYGCSFWDMYSFMGGAGSMQDWVAAKLAARDHIHLTPRGYARMGVALGDALMRAYDAVHLKDRLRSPGAASAPSSAPAADAKLPAGSVGAPGNRAPAAGAAQAQESPSAAPGAPASPSTAPTEAAPAPPAPGTGVPPEATPPSPAPAPEPNPGGGNASSSSNRRSAAGRNAGVGRNVTQRSGRRTKSEPRFGSVEAAADSTN